MRSNSTSLGLLAKATVLSLALLSLGAPVRAWAGQNLLDLVHLAQTKDELFAAARANFDNEVETGAIGLAGLLPSISVTGAATHDQYFRHDLGVRQGRDFSYDPKSMALRISQPLFDLERWANYKEGHIRVERARIVLADAHQDLLLRFTGAYFSFQFARDTLDLAVAQHASLIALRTQTENLFKSGVAVVTDVEETRARQLLAQSQEYAARNGLELKRKELAKIIGSLPPEVEAVAQLSPRLIGPTPNSLESWVGTAREQNLRVLAQKLAVEIAEQGVVRSRAAFRPTASLIANHQRADQPNYFSDREITTTVGVQIAMNLFDGGASSAKVRQAEAQLERTRRELASLVQEAEIKASQAFLELSNGINQITALEQAVKATETTMRGMEIGRQAGLRTNSDVLNAQQQIYTVRRDLQKERYSFLFNRLALAASAGRLGEAEIAGLNRLISN